MVEELQRCCREEPPTPVFFSQGDVCAAQFSEDECWYRARVEKIVKSEVRRGSRMLKGGERGTLGIGGGLRNS